VAVRQDEAVEREVRIAAGPETVFEFLTDPEKQVLWMGRRAELDARPGGIYLVEINDQATARGEFVEVDAPSRVVFTFGWEGQESGSGEHGVPPGSSRVEIALEPDGDGTLVRLRHFDLPEQTREMHGQGWALYLARLEIAATAGDPGPDPNLQADQS
jgi:uncharacterized protein YndB with AHSA1/START domain